MELLIIILASILMIPLAVFTDGVARIVLGLFFILFFPGYTLITALFPRKTDLEAVARLAFSLGASLALAAILLLILHFLPWGIQLYSALIIFFIFTGVTGGIAWRRRLRFDPAERFDPLRNIKAENLFRFWTEKVGRDRVLVAVLAVALIGTMTSIGVVVGASRAGDSYTEFYLLDMEGKAKYYPAELAVGEAGEVIIGIINREGQPATYSVEIVFDGQKIDEIGPIYLSQDEKWEEGVTFTPARTGQQQKVEFLLYRDEGQLYRTLHLWIDVSTPASGA